MQSSSNPLIYLASASPRRSALLTQIGVPHRVRPVDVDESRCRREAPDAIRAAARRAQGRNAVAAACRCASACRCSARTPRSSWTTRSSASRRIEQDCAADAAAAVRAHASGLHRGRAARMRRAASRAERQRRDVPRADRRGDSRRTGAPASRPTRPAATPCRAARRCSSSASRAATPESWGCRCSKPASCCA